MRDLEKRPDNAKVFTVYLPREVWEEVDKVCEMCGMSRNNVIRAMVDHCLPRASVKQKTVYCLDFD